MIRRLLARYRGNADGIVAVEFAFVMPVMMAVFFGGYAIVETVSIARKVSITTRALADLTSQYATMSTSDMQTVINAATQIISPFSSTPLSLRLTEITTDSTGLKATVTWSKAQGTFTAYAPGASFPLPTAMLYPSQSYLFSETSYVYTPVAKIPTGAITMSDHIYMLPRLTTSVTYTGT